MVNDRLDIVFSFDTTGSMYPCLTEVRRKVKDVCHRLFRDIPGIRIGILAHGDYCDKGRPYIVSTLDLNTSEKSIQDFVTTVKSTNGGDAAECYEYVLNVASSAFSWDPSAKKVFVLIADSIPHTLQESSKQNGKGYDWREEARSLTKSGVQIYAVQALGSRYAEYFYKELAEIGGGYKLDLQQFSHIVEAILAICYHQQGDEALQVYEEELKDSSKMNRGIATILSQLRGINYIPSKEYEKAPLHAVHPSRFQVLDVDEASYIKDFVIARGARFKIGRGFYQFTKKELVQERKEVVLVDKNTGDMFSGSKAREMIGLGPYERAYVTPSSLSYDVFIQSTSANRKLLPGTKFLYEMEDWNE